MVHICIKCDKKYSSYKFLWFHNYKYHKIDESIKSQCCVNEKVKAYY